MQITTGFCGNIHSVPFKTQKQSRTTVEKWNQKQVHPRVIQSPNPVTLDSRSPLLLGRCSRQLRQSCAGANMVYSRAERVYILKHYFVSKSFIAVREAFSNAYPDKEVPNKTTIHRLTTFRKVARNTLKRVMFVFEKVVDRICCKTVKLFLTNTN
jgi:hypothetical protein